MNEETTSQYMPPGMAEARTADQIEIESMQVTIDDLRAQIESYKAGAGSWRAEAESLLAGRDYLRTQLAAMTAERDDLRAQLAAARAHAVMDSEEIENALEAVGIAASDGIDDYGYKGPLGTVNEAIGEINSLRAQLGAMTAERDELRAELMFDVLIDKTAGELSESLSETIDAIEEIEQARRWARAWKAAAGRYRMERDTARQSRGRLLKLMARYRGRLKAERDIARFFERELAAEIDRIHIAIGIASRARTEYREIERRGKRGDGSESNSRR